MIDTNNNVMWDHTNNTVMWDIRFLRLAKEISTWSKDPSTKVGSILIDEKNNIISTGYNGFPRGILDTTERYSDRTLRLNLTIHAEMNSILYARRDLMGATLYTTCMPCVDCTKTIIQSGIKTVVSYKDEPFEQRWADSIALTVQYLSEAKISLIKYEYENDSLISIN